jgi:transcription antitermination factor NusG
MKTWYAVYTKKNCEKKVVSQLIKKNISCFTPINNIILNGKDLNEPLIPRYVFLYLAEPELQRIHNITDIINPVYWRNIPITFTNEEIEGFKLFMKFHFNIKKKQNLILNEFMYNINFIEKNSDYLIINADIFNNSQFSFPKLGLFLSGERFFTPVLKPKKKELLFKFLFNLGWS